MRRPADQYRREPRLTLPATCPACGAATRAERQRRVGPGHGPRLGPLFFVWCANRCGWMERYAQVD